MKNIMNPSHRSPLALARCTAFSVLTCSMLILASQPAHARSESVVFAGAEGSSNSSYAYLGTIMPMEGEQLGQGWYRKAVVSMIRYRYESTERGTTEEVSGRAPGVEGGLGYVRRFGERTLDLSGTVGYRNVSLHPFEPKDEKTGNVFTFNPQVMAYTPLGGRFDADLMASYAIGLGSSFARLRAGFKPAEGWRTGLETKRLEGRAYEIRTAGVFVSIPLSEKLRLDLNAGREKPRDDPSAGYGGISFSAVF